MQKACIGRDQTVIADDQAAEMAKPRAGALDAPPPPVTPPPGLLPTEDPRPRPTPSTSSPGHGSSARLWAPLLGGYDATLHTACIPAALRSVVAWGPEGPSALAEDAALCPRLESSPTGTGTALSPGERTPWGAGPTNPKATFQTATLRDARPATPGGPLWFGKRHTPRLPWLRGEFAPRHGSPPLAPWRCMM